MDYKKMLKVLIEKLGEEKLGKMIVDGTCPCTFDLSDVRYCETDPLDCRKCWVEALGLEVNRV
jgi:hypothetical protein